MTARFDVLLAWLERWGKPRPEAGPARSPYVARHRLEDRQDATHRLPVVEADYAEVRA